MTPHHTSYLPNPNMQMEPCFNIIRRDSTLFIYIFVTLILFQATRYHGKAVAVSSLTSRGFRMGIPTRHLVLARYRSDAGKHRPDVEPALKYLMDHRLFSLILSNITLTAVFRLPILNYSLFTLRKVRFPSILNGERAFRRVHRLYLPYHWHS